MVMGDLDLYIGGDRPLTLPLRTAQLPAGERWFGVIHRCHRNSHPRPPRPGHEPRYASRTWTRWRPDLVLVGEWMHPTVFMNEGVASPIDRQRWGSTGTRDGGRPWRSRT